MRDIHVELGRNDGSGWSLGIQGGTTTDGHGVIALWFLRWYAAITWHWTEKLSRLFRYRLRNPKIQCPIGKVTEVIIDEDDNLLVKLQVTNEKTWKLIEAGQKPPRVDVEIRRSECD
jgi:hypothetical protein